MTRQRPPTDQNLTKDLDLAQLITTMQGERTQPASDRTAGFNADRSSREPHNLAALAFRTHEKLKEKEETEASLRRRSSALTTRRSPDRPTRFGLPRMIKWGLGIIVIVLALTQLPKLLPHSQEFIDAELAIVLYQARAEVEVHRGKYGHLSNYQPRSFIVSPILGVIQLHYQRLDQDHYTLTAMDHQGESMAVNTEGLAFRVSNEAKVEERNALKGVDSSSRHSHSSHAAGRAGMVNWALDVATLAVVTPKQFSRAQQFFRAELDGIFYRTQAKPEKHRNRTSD